MLNMTLASRIATLLFSLVLVACQDSGRQAEKSAAEGEGTMQIAASQVMLPGEEAGLAKVEGQVITQYDLNLAISNMLGDRQAATLDEESRKKVLESMVLSKAMAISTEKTMSTEEKRTLDKKVSSYREQLLAKSYLATHAEPLPVTSQMVTDYYNKHLDRFGQRTIYHYELLIGGSEINGEGRKALLASLQQAKAAPNWKGLSKQWKSEGHNISYRQAKGTLDVLDVKLANLLQGLKPNETSNVVFQDGAPTIVRLNQKQVLPARPLSQVSAEIRKSLVPVQLKKQIEKISTEITKTTKVEYLN